MRKLYKPNAASDRRSIKATARRMSIEHNLTLNVIDQQTGKVVQSHTSHNAATNSLLTGIGHYLMGDGVYNQAYDMLSRYVPRYISLGTMGLYTQDEEYIETEEGKQKNTHLPLGLGGIDDPKNDDEYIKYGYDVQTQHLCNYISQCPGYGADGYQANQNNGRPFFGLGPMFDSREDKTQTINCELISKAFPRAEISFRDIVPEYEAEVPKTIDVIYSAMVSTGALSSFRDTDKDYIFITEAGLWATRPYLDSGDNGLLAGYRIVPPNQHNWNFGTFVEGTFSADGQQITPDHYITGGVINADGSVTIDEDLKEEQEHNQQLLKENILRVSRNQIVQVIWKIQLGGLEQLGGMSELYPSLTSGLIWELWDND